jgi:DNA-binding transcriptional regulator YdaS (Cro superfamily)
MNLKTWLEAERGRSKALADHLDVTAGRITQMANDGVPPKFMLAVRRFTGGKVTLASLLKDRTHEKAA